MKQDLRAGHFDLIAWSKLPLLTSQEAGGSNVNFYDPIGGSNIQMGSHITADRTIEFLDLIHDALHSNLGGNIVVWRATLRGQEKHNQNHEPNTHNDLRNSHGLLLPREPASETDDRSAR